MVIISGSGVLVLLDSDTSQIRTGVQEHSHVVQDTSLDARTLEWLTHCRAELSKWEPCWVKGACPVRNRV